MEAPETSGTPRVQRILEAALYVSDVVRSARFYGDVLGLEELTRTDHFVALDAGGGTVLLLFEQGSTTEGTSAGTAGGRIPPHGTSGDAHVAFAVEGSAELDRWERHLTEHGIAIESRVTWPRGGESIYFRDPDGHSIELAAPGVWAVH